MDPQDYRPHRDLPPLAGIATIPEAMRIGLSVDDCVARLKRHHWAFRRLHQILVDRLTAEPIYELKMGFSLHAYYCAEHAAAWRKRVAENWWPALYREWCRVQQRPPEAAVLAYQATYASIRADLRELSASG